VLIWTI
jgi:hypothetical protein